jgi:hypothetical protein
MTYTHGNNRTGGNVLPPKLVRGPVEKENPVKRKLLSGWSGLSLWLIIGGLPAWGGDLAHFQAMQLVRFSQAVTLPHITLPDLDGKPVALQIFLGKVVLLNFWTTW